MGPVVCGSCGARLPVSGLTEDDRRSLQDQHDYQEFAEELRMLRKAQDFYRRYPDAEGRVNSYFDRLFESDDPEVRERLWAGVPFGPVERPPEHSPAAAGGEEDREVVEYLRHHNFLLGPRLRFVTQEVARLQGSVGAVSCPHCQGGRLHVPSEDWDEFTAGGTITWYWPDWHGVDTDGVLHVKASGWRSGCHGTGEQAVSPTEPDYDFWRWLVTQEAYHRLVEESELPAIRQEWSRRTKGCT